MFGHRAGDAAPRFDVVRGYLRFYGPASPAQVAAFLEAPVREVRAAWPRDTIPVTVQDHDEDGVEILAEDEAAVGRARRAGAPSASSRRMRSAARAVCNAWLGVSK